MKSRILVVDDQPNNVKLLADLLGFKGYDVMTAQSGPEALEKVQSNAFDLILLDVIMPQMSGYEVCKRIRESHGEAILPIIMVTALDPSEERIKGLEAGADDFLTKPINQPELLARVRSLLRIKELYDKLELQKREIANLNAGLEERVKAQVEELQRMAQLKRFFPPQLAEMIVAGNIDDPLKTRRREVTIVFLDLRGFTAFADNAEPEDVISLLRDYHAEMGKLIHAYEGSLEQFAGDSLMVIFNDPVVMPDPAVRAVRMAVEMHQRFNEFMKPWRRRGHEIDLGIGVAHGYATIGAIGFEDRIGYGVIGRVTNLAARLCSEAKAGQILVSAPVHALVEDLVEAEAIGELQLKGFMRPVPAFNIRGLKAAS